MAADTWLKFQTSILNSAKFCSLPDNDHKWLFVCLMIFCKKNLITESSGLIPNGLPILLANGTMNHRKFRRVSNGLMKAGLIESNLWVIGFNDSQLTPGAMRMKRHRERHSDATSDAKSDGRGRGRGRSREREEAALNSATEKEIGYARRLLTKHGINPDCHLKISGATEWTSDLVDDVVRDYRDAPVSIGPRPVKWDHKEPEPNEEDRAKALAYLETLKNGEKNGKGKIGKTG